MSTLEDVSRRRGGREARKAMRARTVPVAEAAVRPGMEAGRYKPLAASDLERIHHAALEVLETVGFADAIPSCLEALTAKGCFVNADGRRFTDEALHQHGTPEREPLREITELHAALDEVPQHESAAAVRDDVEGGGVRGE